MVVGLQVTAPAGSAGRVACKTFRTDGLECGVTPVPSRADGGVRRSGASVWGRVVGGAARTVGAVQVAGAQRRERRTAWARHRLGQFTSHSWHHWRGARSYKQPERAVHELPPCRLGWLADRSALGGSGTGPGSCLGGRPRSSKRLFFLTATRGFAENRSGRLSGLVLPQQARSSVNRTRNPAT